MCISLCSTGHALSEKLPFIGSKFPFEVNVSDQPTLNEYTNNLLKQHRKDSSEFALMSSANSAMQFDRGILQKALESRGYFQPKVSSKVEEGTIVYQITAGPLYRVKRIRFNFPKDIDKPSSYVLPLQEEAALNAQHVLDTVNTLKAHIAKHNCLYNIQLHYTAEVNHQTHEGFITFHLAPSQHVKFGAPQVFGTKTVAPEYLKKQLTFNKGDCFDRTEIEKSRLALLQTNLVARTDLIIGPPIAGQVTVSFDVTERSHRTIKAGVGYSSDTRGNLILGWEHRNLFGSAQKLETDLTLSKIEQRLEAELTLPNFLRDDQTLVIATNVVREVPKAYDSTQSEISATVSRPLFKHLQASVGAALEFSRVIKDDNKEDYSLFSLPVGLDYNNTNDLLNPKKGWALAIKSRPYVNLYQTGIRYFEHSIIGSTYFTAEQWLGEPTLAVRLAMGTITYGSFDEIPADHRFYVGGGGSVRGYEYQSLSALDDEEPLGGLSFSEMSIELRFKLTQSWGITLFSDGGFAHEDRTPKLMDQYLWSAGFGVSYYTSFAPIRFDIARPLDIRYSDVTGNRIDSPFHIYISIGQAF